MCRDGEKLRDKKLAKEKPGWGTKLAYGKNWRLALLLSTVTLLSSSRLRFLAEDTGGGVSWATDGIAPEGVGRDGEIKKLG